MVKESLQIKPTYSVQFRWWSLKTPGLVRNFRNRRAATGVQTKVSEIEKGGELLLVHQF